ncbi:polyprenyl synthetase family protein [Streptomyces sp. NPDC048845]|uniref:polyprenyl synthetase family protein n=1 Tax=Streptomyces sp. NPDC048845 TaxID=3155390 RepID=UPI003428DE47
MTAAPTCESGLDGVPAAVDAVLEDFLGAKARVTGLPCLPEVARLLKDFLAGGGKRLRPLLCCCGWRAAGGEELAPVLPAAASLELFHTFALIHDDLMDRSDTRRGRPTVHRSLAAGLRGRAHRVDAERFGTNGAVLLGDLAMVWSDELLHTAWPETATPAARPVLERMRSEVMYGQYLDLLAGTRFGGGLDGPLTVIRYKTAKYTVERPLQLGAALAGGGRTVLDACSAYGIPLGEAFQLRDDLLGVFGDPAVTGKPCLDDLREGKYTVLLALAVERADRRQQRVLRDLVGDPGLDERGAGAVRAVLTATGAADRVEGMITARRREALLALEHSPFPSAVRGTLRRLATTATVRNA